MKSINKELEDLFDNMPCGGLRAECTKQTFRVWFDCRAGNGHDKRKIAQLAVAYGGRLGEYPSKKKVTIDFPRSVLDGPIDIRVNKTLKAVALLLADFGQMPEKIKIPKKRMWF